MKKLFAALMLLAFIGSGFAGAHAQISSVDTLVHRLFATLKAKDTKAYVALYPSPQQLSRFMKKAIAVQRESLKGLQQRDSSQQDKSSPVNFDSLLVALDSAMTAQFNELSKPENYPELEKKYTKGFAPALKQGEEKGVVWSAATLTGYSLDSSAQEDSASVKMLGPGYKNMKGVLDFRSNAKDYQLSFDNAVYFPEEGGWFGGQFKEVIRKGERFSPPPDVFKGDSIDSVVTRPRLPAKSKTKAKTKAGEVKTKTKSPARKPSTKS